MSPAQTAPDLGGPVNPMLGAKVLSGDEDLDFVLEGPLPLQWQRVYRSNNPHVGWFGQGWTSPLERRLQAVPDAQGSAVDHVDFIDAFGRHIEFPLLERGGTFFSRSEQLTLSRTTEGQYVVEDSEGVFLWFAPRPDGNHRLTAISDRNDNAIHIDYREEAGQLRSVFVSCSGGQLLEIVFAEGRPAAAMQHRQDPQGRRQTVLSSYRYTPYGDLAEVLNRAGERVRALRYGADRLMAHQWHASGFEAWYDYEGSGKTSRVVRNRNNVGGAWTLNYFDDRTEVVDQEGRIAVYHLDARRRWIGLTDAAGDFTRRALDRYGNVRAIVDPAENVTETEFDERSNPVKFRDADGSVTQVEWHPQFALPLAITDPLHRTTTYEYDNRGNLVLETDATGAQTRYRRDARGLAVEIEDALGGIRQQRFNDRAQAIQVTDCSGLSTWFDYDEDGNLTCVTNALGERTTFAYDEAGQLIRHTLADGCHRAYVRDVAGRLTSITDALGHVTRFRYTADSQLAQRTDALGHTMRYDYDRARRLVALINENGERYAFRHDALDQVVEERRFDGLRMAFRYDEAGYRVECTELPEGAPAIVTRYGRDRSGRLLSRATGRLEASYEYDAAGQMVRAREAGVEIELSYDAVGRLVKERVEASGRSFVTGHVYDGLGNRLESTLPNGTRLSSLHYGSGHVHQIRVNGEALSDIERDQLHREVSRSQGALQSTRSYDPAGRLTRQFATRRAEANLADGDGTLVDRRYDYDAAGRLVRALDRGRSLTYDYDAIDRLTRFDDEHYVFDPAHNLVAAGRDGAIPGGHANAGRLMVREGVRFSYDAHGRLVEKRIGADTTVTLVWNDWHRLEASRTSTSGTSQETRYLYDPLGRRIAKQTAVGLTWFVWIEDQLTQELTDDFQRTFIYEPDSFTPLAVLPSREGTAISVTHALYFHCDQVGLPRELSDVDGIVRWEGTYSGWGRLDQKGADALSVQPLRFEGQYHDEETGLHYNRHRYYDPDLAAFITTDPIGLAGGENLFQYAPNPVDWSDPYGLYNKRRKNGQFAGKPGPKKQTDTSHGCSLETTKPAQGYELRDRGTDEVQKYGETTRGTLRYTKEELKSENVRMVFVAKGSKKEMKDWENQKIKDYKASHGGCRPRLNKSDH